VVFLCEILHLTVLAVTIHPGEGYKVTRPKIIPTYNQQDAAFLDLFISTDSVHVVVIWNYIYDAWTNEYQTQDNR